jgi:hypothetical protein
MTIRMVALDLDGTLLNSHSEVSPANARALAKAVERGVHVVVITGRRYHSARKFLEQIPCPVTLVTSNGARITSSAGEVLHRNYLPASVARQALRQTREFRPFAAALFDRPDRGQITMQEGAAPEGPLGWYQVTSGELLLMVPDLEAHLAEQPIQVLFGGPPAIIEKIEPLLRKADLAGRIHLSWTKYPERNVVLLDVMNRGCTKGAALKWWADRHGLAPDEVMAIGDNFNDHEMLTFAGHPVVMANRTPGFGTEGWKSTLSNDEDGVAHALESYVLR